MRYDNPVCREELSDNVIYQRHRSFYLKTAEVIGGDVLEIGPGFRLGFELLAPLTNSYLAADREEQFFDIPQGSRTAFRRIDFPPLTDIDSAAFDFVVCHDVIEHVKDDFGLVAEIRRVLRPGGKLILSTPNRNMSITRNPWHWREYRLDELLNLIGCHFDRISALGMYGSEKVNRYFERNRQEVAAILRFDFLRLHQWLPRRILKEPYRFFNRLNRRRLLIANRRLTASITPEDFILAEASDHCYDFYFTAEKQ